MHLRNVEATPSRQLRLSADQFVRVRSLVYDQSGIFFQERKKYLLESRIGQRMRALGLTDFESYLYGAAGVDSNGELARLVNAVTINETYFFRNPGQFEVLMHEMLPSIVARKKAAGQNTVNIWSAGCSTGDEGYTLAILIEEHAKQRWPRFQFCITGTDINTEVLAQARRGRYGSYAVRNVPEHLMTKYFASEGADHVLSDRIRTGVRFLRHNLIGASGPAPQGTFDVVLCANVLIYFDMAARRRAVETIYKSLAGGGVLLVGFSESLNGVSEVFEPVRHSRMVAYRKD